MNPLPTPPEAWWGAVPWWAYFSWVATLALIAGPFGWRARQGRAGSAVDRERSIAERENALLDDLRTDNERLRALLDHEREDKLDGWNRGRGMEDRAHGLWHQLNIAVNRYNATLLVCQRLLDGTYSTETARARIAALDALTAPEPLPRLTEVPPTSAQDARYG